MHANCPCKKIGFEDPKCYCNKTTGNPFAAGCPCRTTTATTGCICIAEPKFAGCF